MPGQLPLICPPGPGRFAAPENDQWDYLLSSIWSQMLHLVVSLEGRLNHARLMQAALLLADSIPLLNCRFVEEPGSAWERLPAPDPGTVCPLVEDPSPGAIQQALVTRLDPAEGPQYRVTLVRGESDTLILSVNHSACDASGVRFIARSLCTAYRELAVNPGFTLPREDPCDRSLDPVLARFAPGERERFFRESGGLTADWGMPFRTFTCTSPGCRWISLDQAQFRAMKTSAQEHSVTVNDLLLAAFFSTLQEYIPHQPGREYPVLTSIDLRRYLGPHAPAVANLSVAFEVRLPAGLPYSRTMGRVHAAMQEKKDNHAGIGAAVRVVNQLSAGLPAARSELQDLKRRSREDRYPKNPFFTNTGVIQPECADYGDIRTTGAFLAPPVDYPPSFGLAASTFAGRLTLSTCFCRDALPAALVEELLSRMAGLLSPP